MKYLLWIEGKETGPYEQREVEAAVADGTIYSDTLARRETGISWDPIEILLPSVKDVVPVQRNGKSEAVTAAVVESRPRPPVAAMSRGLGAFITLLLLGVLALLIWDHVKPPTRWEYRTVVIPSGSPASSEASETSDATVGRADEVALTELGGEGWELAGSYASNETPKQGEGDATDLIAVDPTAKPVVLLFKRAERNSLVARYIDPLWRKDSKAVANVDKDAGPKPDEAKETKSETDSKPSVEPVTEEERVPEVKVALPEK